MRESQLPPFKMYQLSKTRLASRYGPSPSSTTQSSLQRSNQPQSQELTRRPSSLLLLLSRTSAHPTASHATCTPTPTTYTTTSLRAITTVRPVAITTSTSAQPYCPTITSTEPRSCPPPPSTCIVPDCIVETTTTLSCPAACCPSRTATTVVKESCVTT